MLKRAPVIEVISDEMAEILRRKTGFERLAIADAMIQGARELIESSIRYCHPD